MSPIEQVRLDKITRDIEIDPEYFNEFEHHFVESLIASPQTVLTIRQKNTFDDIWNKAQKR